MRSTFTICAALGLAACSPSVPDSGQGVGFSDYGAYLRAQAAAKAYAPTQTPYDQTMAAQPFGAQPMIAQPSTGFSTEAAAAAIDNSGTAPLPFQYENASVPQGQVIGAPLAAIPQAAETAPAAFAADQPRGVTPQGIKEMTMNYATDTAGVSNEQDFDAVSASRTIEGDKAQIERNKAQYKIDQPTAVPERTGAVGPSIVEYALATQHPLGVKLFRRSPFRFKDPQAACSAYDTEDSAQEAFLSAGGPDRDRLGLDPDGDGFACGWDPSPFRAIAQ
jgi:hypothetical protein